mmetsp:Transcript_53524/g.107239  ORF Transcript_53524/g.107239 Transcript_53524/m.107239 type:complete len:392 (+) Transcript_53524:178-1353(+)
MNTNLQRRTYHCACRTLGRNANTGGISVVASSAFSPSKTSNRAVSAVGSRNSCASVLSRCHRTSAPVQLCRHTPGFPSSATVSNCSSVVVLPPRCLHSSRRRIRRRCATWTWKSLPLCCGETPSLSCIMKRYDESNSMDERLVRSRFRANWRCRAPNIIGGIIACASDDGSKPCTSSPCAQNGERSLALNLRADSAMSRSSGRLVLAAAAHKVCLTSALLQRPCCAAVNVGAMMAQSFIRNCTAASIHLGAPPHIRMRALATALSLAASGPATRFSLNQRSKHFLAIIQLSRTLRGESSTRVTGRPEAVVKDVNGSSLRLENTKCWRALASWSAPNAERTLNTSLVSPTLSSSSTQMIRCCDGFRSDRIATTTSEIEICCMKRDVRWTKVA